MNKQNTNSTVEATENFIDTFYESFKGALEFGGFKDSIVAHIKDQYTPNSKLQESNEKYLEGFYLRLLAKWVKTNGSVNIKKLKDEYNKLNGGGK